MKNVAIVAFCIALACPAYATTYIPVDFATIVSQSQTIAHGRVVDVRSIMTVPEGRIESIVTLTVIDAIKGVADSTLSFQVPNGQIGRYRRILVGAPEFAPGDDVIVFLRGGAPQLPSIFGVSQGVYRVGRDSTARAVVSRVPLAGADGPVVRGDPARQPLALDAFIRQVHDVMERPQ